MSEMREKKTVRLEVGVEFSYPNSKMDIVTNFIERLYSCIWDASVKRPSDHLQGNLCRKDRRKARYID